MHSEVDRESSGDHETRNCGETGAVLSRLDVLVRLRDSTLFLGRILSFMLSSTGMASAKMRGTFLKSFLINMMRERVSECPLKGDRDETGSLAMLQMMLERKGRRDRRRMTKTNDRVSQVERFDENRHSVRQNEEKQRQARAWRGGKTKLISHLPAHNCRCG